MKRDCFHVIARIYIWMKLGWFDTMCFQKRVVTREEARLKFDHYNLKIVDLRREHEKTLAKGKPESAKDQERRERVRQLSSTACYVFLHDLDGPVPLLE